MQMRDAIQGGRLQGGRAHHGRRSGGLPAGYGGQEQDQEGIDSPRWTCSWCRIPDIISEVKGDIVKVGFAAESEDLVKNATVKLKRKSLHLIVANNITEAQSGFGTDTNKVTLIDSQGKIEALPLLPKSEVAHKVLDKVVTLLSASRTNPGKPRRRK